MKKQNFRFFRFFLGCVRPVLLHPISTNRYPSLTVLKTKLAKKFQLFCLRISEMIFNIFYKTFKHKSHANLIPARLLTFLILNET